MYWLWMLVLCLSSCTAPIYQNTMYGIEEFVADSDKINLGKQAILKLQDQNQMLNLSDLKQTYFEEVAIEDDVFYVVLYCPKRLDRVRSLAQINQSLGFKVCNGCLQFPELAPIEVIGLTLNEIQSKIEKAYQEQMPEAQIFISFKKRRERQVQVIGAIHSLINIKQHMRLSEVLAKAQIPSDANLFKSYVMREGISLPVDLYQLIHEGREEQNIVMRGGDQIFIAPPISSTVMLTGEVLYPINLPIPYGFISLRHALVMAGGIPFTGNKECIQVIRGNFIRPKIYCLDWIDITHLPNQSLLLIPGDVVIISEKPITEWNRFINQLQPSTNNLQNTYNIYRLIQISTP